MAARVTDSEARLRDALADRYEIQGELGRGATSRVYLARDLRHQRDVALKVLREELALTIGAERFRREIAQWAPLVHPNILPLLDSGEADGLLYFTTPAVTGESLRDRMTREVQLPLTDALSIACDVADALAHAHDAGLVHRDVKPENILMSGSRALLGDFGYARMLVVSESDRITGSGLAIGTPRYASPEQLTGGATVDPRSDQYSLGCVLYEMLAGQPPFAAPTAQGIVARHLMDRPTPLRHLRPAVPVQVEHLVARLLEKVPADRYASTHTLALDLRAAVEAAHAAERASGGSADALVRFDTPPSGRRARWPAGAALAAVGIAVLATWWVARGVPRSAGTGAVDVRQIAVLPFEDESSDSTMRWLAAGLTTDLIESLRAASALSVRSSAAVRAFRGSSAPIDSIARALHVGTVITGTVRRVGDSISVATLVTDAATGDPVGPMIRVALTGHAVDSARTAVVDGVAAQLRRALGQYATVTRRRREASSTIAWELLQRGDGARLDAEALIQRGDTAPGRQLLTQADSLLARAAQLAPRWAEPVVQRGWVALATSDLNAERVSEECEPACMRWRRAAIALADEALDRERGDLAALELHGASTSALATGVGAAEARAMRIRAERELRGVVERDPARASAWVTLSLLYDASGEFARAAWAARQAVEADAYLDEAKRLLESRFFDSLRHGEMAEAARDCAVGGARYETYVPFTECRLTLLGWTGHTSAQIDSAWRELRRIDSLGGRFYPDPDSSYRRAMIAAVIARRGLADSARAVLRETEAQHPRPGQGWYFQRAYVELLLGDTAQTLADLRRQLALEPEWRDFVRSHPWFAPLRANRAFLSLTDPRRP